MQILNAISAVFYCSTTDNFIMYFLSTFLRGTVLSAESTYIKSFNLHNDLYLNTILFV